MRSFSHGAVAPRPCIATGKGVGKKIDKVEIEMCEIESTLPTLLRKFSEPERLSEERRCGGCHRLAIVDKSISIEKTPVWLVISLKRFSVTDSGNSVKNSQHVEFPLENLQINEKSFDLYAVVCHSGSRASGHYFSFILYNNHWYYCNDSHVERSNSLTVSMYHENAYVLFYKARQSSQES